MQVVSACPAPVDECPALQPPMPLKIYPRANKHVKSPTALPATDTRKLARKNSRRKKNSRNFVKRAKSSTLSDGKNVATTSNYNKITERSRDVSTASAVDRLRGSGEGRVRFPLLVSAATAQRHAANYSRKTPQPTSEENANQTGKYKNVPLLTAIKPDNVDAEKNRFLRAKFNYNPYFLYKYPLDSDVLERYGNSSDRLIHLAVKIMDNALKRYGSYEEFERVSGGPIQTRGQILQAARKYLRREGVDKEVMVLLSEDLMSRGAMTRIGGHPTLAVRVTNMRQHWMEGLLRHEIGTHYLRSSNNRYQIWNSWKKRKDLNMGALNPTEEGLASLHSVLFREDPCLWRAALLYYTAYHAVHMSFSELFKNLEKFVKDPHVRWDYCMRAKRGQSDTSKPGGFCKDQVYLKGALELLRHRKRIDFSLLTKLGKICYKDIDLLRDFAELENTRIPSFMSDLKVYNCELERIMDGNGVTDEDLEDVF